MESSDNVTIHPISINSQLGGVIAAMCLISSVSPIWSIRDVRPGRPRRTGEVLAGVSLNPIQSRIPPIVVNEANVLSSGKSDRAAVGKIESAMANERIDRRNGTRNAKHAEELSLESNIGQQV